MSTQIEKKLSKFMFPVSERKVYVEDFLKGKLNMAAEYKAIFREDKNRLISIQKSSYKVIPNKDVIMPLMEELDKLDARWHIEENHSYVIDSRMKIGVVFPDLTLNDERSDIALSLYLENSFDSSISLRLLFGAIRFQCSNGLILGHVLSNLKRKHTQGLNLRDLKEQVHKTYDQIPIIKDRIETLKRLEVTREFRAEVKYKFGSGIDKYIEEQPYPKSQWILCNYITYFVSHMIQMHMRSQYQIQVSKLFKL